MVNSKRILAWSGLVAGLGYALPDQPLNDQINAAIDAGTFQNPSVNIRPKFRYWLPDASVDPAQVAADIADIGSKGAGGVQFLNYYLYGGGFGSSAATDWDIYGFGTPAYNKVLLAALQAHKDNGLIMDFEMGPQSGQGVPAEIDNPGLTYDMNSYSITAAPNTTYNGTIPGYGSGTLVSVTSAFILSNQTSQTVVVKNRTHGDFQVADTFTLNTIKADSLTDVTNTTSNGTISISFPPQNVSGQYILYASYYFKSLVRACIPGPDPQNFLQNGSFVVDHFSATGAKVTTDFLEQYVLINGVKELLQEVGNYIWEDSVEITSPLYWTPALASTFLQMHGYDIGKYTILLAQNNGYQSGPVATEWYVTDAADQGQGYVSDYRATLTYLLTTYYDHLTNWTNSYLGLQFSGQVGYNLPVDMMQVEPHVNAPEDEMLQGNNLTDGYRQVSGAGNLAGKRIISNEMGATPYGAFMQGLPNLYAATKRAWVGGNNQMILHGATYTSQYPQTTWPGYTSFEYLFAEQHSRHQPGWELGYSDYLNYGSRVQWVLQSGAPKRDIAFWDKQTDQPNEFPTLYPSLDLIEAGYGYEYISPENFNLPLAVVRNGILAPDGPSYKVLIIRQTDILTTPGVIKVVDYANQGLPIILYGGMPTAIASTTGLAEAQARLQSITSLANVHQVASGSIASAVASIGIQPWTSVSSNSTWITFWRSDPSIGAEYSFIYNDGGYGEGTISFASTGTPYWYDAWTGDQKPVLQYTVNGSYTTIPFKLRTGETKLVAFLSTAPPGIPPAHVISAPSTVLGFEYNTTTGLIAKVPALSPSGTVQTSDGKSYPIPAGNVSSTFSLSNWTLVAESWGPSSDFYDIETTVKTNTTYQLPALLSWPEIKGLANTSGVGYYNNTFNWNDTSIGAIIDFQRIVHTIRVKINGVSLPPLDNSAPIADISQYLITGVNTVEAVIATTMFNGLIPFYDQMETSGIHPVIGITVPPVSGSAGGLEAGLVGTVVITPYQPVQILSLASTRVNSFSNYFEWPLPKQG